MQKITIEGMSSANERRLRSYLKGMAGELKAPVRIKVHSPIFYKRQDSLWYGGDETDIYYRNWRFELWANGDVYADLYERPDMRHIFYVKDKNNAGHLAEELISYIGSDRALYEACEGEHPQYLLQLTHNNWWESFAVTPDGHFVDLMWCLESDMILPAIAEIVGAMEGIIEEKESMNGDKHLCAVQPTSN